MGMPSTYGPDPVQGQHSHSHAKAPTLSPTWKGFVHTTMDAMMIFEACLSGYLHHIPRRPHDKERPELITSGSCFVYEENASGIKRWTDGMSWSPSRIMGNFLVYRELNQPFPPGEKKRAKRKRSVADVGNEANYRTSSDSPELDSPTKAHSAEDRRLVGSLIDSYGFKKGGLIKKTLSISSNQCNHHIICYYTLEDIKAGKYLRPIQHPELAHLRPRPSLLEGTTKFRSPLSEGLDDVRELAQWEIGDQQQDINGRAIVQPRPRLSVSMPNGMYTPPPVDYSSAMITHQPVTSHPGQQGTPVSWTPSSHPSITMPTPSHNLCASPTSHPPTSGVIPPASTHSPVHPTMIPTPELSRSSVSQAYSDYTNSPYQEHLPPPDLHPAHEKHHHPSQSPNLSHPVLHRHYAVSVTDTDTSSFCDPSDVPFVSEPQYYQPPYQQFPTSAPAPHPRLQPIQLSAALKYEVNPRIRELPDEDNFSDHGLSPVHSYHPDVHTPNMVAISSTDSGPSTPLDMMSTPIPGPYASYFYPAPQPPIPVMVGHYTQYPVSG